LPAFRRQGGRPGGSGRSTEAPLWVGRRMKRVPAPLASYDLWQRSPPGGQTCPSTAAVGVGGPLSCVRVWVVGPCWAGVGGRGAGRGGAGGGAA
jgi:hypothetical protein